jgi:hypothetical protein
MNLEPTREQRLGEIAVAEVERGHKLEATEAAILDTLRKLLPSAALSYQQALSDLASEGRVSFRGTAAELRETLRDVLDHLAPDVNVVSSSGFTLEKDRTTPTMRQKVRFILKSRRMVESAMKTPEDNTVIVEEYRASSMRSTYDRASIATHVTSSRQEVRQVKRYVDSVLCELLEIH